MDDIEIINNEYCQFVNWVWDLLVYFYFDYYVEIEDGEEWIDWEYEIDWEDEILEDLYYQGDDCFVGKKEFDVSKLVFEYEWYDWQKAVYDYGCFL